MDAPAKAHRLGAGSIRSRVQPANWSARVDSRASGIDDANCREWSEVARNGKWRLRTVLDTDTG